MAAYKIQNKWKDAIVDPNCRLGDITINRGYDECFKI